MKYSVTKYMKERFGGEEFIIGKSKQRCPQCGKATLSIKSDDTLIKCFHPDCSFVLYEAMIKEENSIQRLLNQIFVDFNYELRSLKKEEYGAYDYLVNGRKIHEDVIDIAMLGAVPTDYDINETYASIVEELEKEKRHERDKDKIDKLDLEIDQINKFNESFNKILSFNKGWICFFLIDQSRKIQGIRLRKPYAKEFASIKIKSGVFSLGFETQSENENSSLLIVEGEMNLLQLQSLQLRLSKDREDISYINAIAIGSASNVNYRMIKAINPNPIFSWDSDDAGFAVVEDAREHMHVSGFVTPDPHSDLDEYIRSFSDDYEAAGIAVERLIANREYYYRHYEPVANEVNKIRAGKDKEFLIQQETATSIITDLKQRGQFYFDGNTCYFFSEEEKHLIRVSKEDRNVTLLLSKYNITPTEVIFNYLIENIKIEAMTSGKHSRIHRFTYYDKVNYTLYLYDNKNGVYKITKNKVDLVDNGFDGVLFIGEKGWEPFEIDKSVDSNLFEEVIVNKINFDEDILSISDRRLIFKIWFLGLFYESIQPTKPIICFLGGKGSGKSATIRKVGMLLFGSNFDVTPIGKNPDDIDVAASNSYLLGLDNADSRSDWLEDRMATISTGGKIKKRALYTNNQMVEIETHCFLAITSRTPHFRRDDVSDRLLIMRVSRLNKFIAENIILNEVLENRNSILSEIVKELQLVLQALEENKEHQYEGKLRMADFADLAIKIASVKNKQDDMDRIFKLIAKSQTEFTLEQDPIVDMIYAWLENPHNRGRMVSAAILYQDLEKIAIDNDEKFLFKSHRGLAMKLSHIKSNLENYFEVREYIGAARKREYSFDYKREEKEDVGTELF